MRIYRVTDVTSFGGQYSVIAEKRIDHLRLHYEDVRLDVIPQILFIDPLLFGPCSFVKAYVIDLKILHASDRIEAKTVNRTGLPSWVVTQVYEIDMEV